jgi:hypothetical protein
MVIDGPGKRRGVFTEKTSFFAILELPYGIGGEFCYFGILCGSFCKDG